MSLYEIRLPAGDVSGFSIDHESGTGQPQRWSREWLSKGHEGVRIIGAGIDRTHMRCTGHDGITMFIENHPGVVQFENMTIHTGVSRGVYTMGRGPNVRPDPKFKIRFLGVKGVALPPTANGGRAFWWAHLYQVDADAEDVVLDCEALSEHPWYHHNYSKYGVTWKRVEVLGGGGEDFKSRGDAIETAYCGKQAKITIKDCVFKNWYQPWSNRGGTGVCLQGAAADLVIDSCIFWGGGPKGSIPASARSKCVMVSSEGDSYDILTGNKVTGFGNGYVIVKNSAMRGGPGQENYTTILRVGCNGGSQKAARGVLVEGCGIWGQRMSVQLKDVPSGKVAIRSSNTPAIRDRCEAIGMDTTHEAGVPTASRVVPISEGFAA